MRIFRTKFKGWCKYFSPIIILVSLRRKLAPSRNVVCIVTSSSRMAWTLSLNIFCKNPVVDENFLILAIDRGWKSYRLIILKLRRRTHSHNLWVTTSNKRNSQDSHMRFRCPLNQFYFLQRLACSHGARTSCGTSCACIILVLYWTFPHNHMSYLLVYSSMQCFHVLALFFMYL